MDVIREFFNNREIAIGVWVAVAITALFFMKPMRQSFKTIIRILFCKKFIVFYVVFIGFLFLVISALKWAELWDIGLLKDTIFWVLFVELPLFAKAIEKAKGGRFFVSLIKENIAVSVLIEFFIGFWTFSLWMELILVPLTVGIALLYAVSEREKKHQPIKKFFDGLMVIWGIVLVINAICHLFQAPEQFINLSTLKSFLLPVVLLILNLPVVYGLALYSTYEEIFIRLKGKNTERVKMKIQIFFFAGINLAKATALRNSIPETILCSLTAKDLQNNLKNLTQRLSLQIGDNYMKRSHYYIGACITGLIVSLIGLVLANSEVPLKDLITFNFILDIQRIKEIVTYIFSTMLVFSISLLVFAIGFGKRQREDISQIKKYALYELLGSVKRQEAQLMEFPPIDDPSILYATYVLNAYEVKSACDRVLSAYSNLLTTWERDTVKQLQLYVTSFTGDFEISTEDIKKYNAVSFSKYYNEKVKAAPQSENFNNFTYMVQTDLKKYSEQIKQFCVEFKQYY